MNKEFQRLAIRFRQQEEFSTGYSPLYALLFRLVADWLEAPGAAADPAVNWLVEAGRGRDSLTVTLLLAAGLHRDVLVGEGRVEDLASYYPSAGGLRFPDEPGFESALRQAIHAQRESLKTFIRSANVQTNETGRGLCWLLPVLSSGWQAVQLVDLGASAGLNLVAERRAYRLQEAGSERYLADLGTGWPPQFMVRCQGDVDPISRFGFRHVPRITGRIGCDIIPFPLVTEDDALTLEAFIWADQVTRIQRLREGIQA